MTNRINQIMHLADGKNYIVAKQAVYKNENYYAVIGVADDEETLLEDYAIFREILIDDQVNMEQVTDLDTLKLIMKYLNIATDEEWNKLIEENK